MDRDKYDSEALELFGCPGFVNCSEAPTNTDGDGNKLFPCKSCKMPPFFFAKDGTKVYRSYADYCDD